ncbi:hypothetical protein DENIS_0879 [Desulfonema ishimotonii]|uniref:Teneurin-like YD-shell domain-containing protein n=2 Tax=Desulfonema ishimotonii TaxID=45657 RepID=A0A401FSJ9_9BACT|nr:hypothetical protein DENIS_0879 [Desulfonema ishimotonii]
MTKGGQRYYLAYDQVGTLRAVTDASGNAVKRIGYDTFGNVISDSNTAFAVPFGFAGGLYDADTGLIRFGYRDYDPDTGRWTAKDPIGFAGGDTDLYGYCLGDPINWIDPDGLEDIPGKLIGKKGGVTIEHYGSADHGPAHAHVKGQGTETKIGPKGHPLKRQPPLSHRQKQAVEAYRKEIRKELNKLGRAYMRIFKNAQGPFMFEWQKDYMDYINKGYPTDLDSYYLDENGRLKYKSPCI